MSPLHIVRYLIVTSLLTSAPISPGLCAEQRLRTVDYRAGEIHTLYGCVGFETAISLAPDEWFEDIVLGDSSLWRVTPNQRGSLLFVKPISAHALTNMTILTDQRTYQFELDNAPSEDCAKGRIIYTLQFRYPSKGR